MSAPHWDGDYRHLSITSPPVATCRLFRQSVRFRCALEPAVSAVYWRAHEAANVPPGTSGSSVPAFRSPMMRLYRQPPAAASAQARGTVKRRVGRAVPVTPLRGVTGEPQRWSVQCGAGIPACPQPPAQTGMSAPHWDGGYRHVSPPIGSTGGFEDEDEDEDGISTHQAPSPLPLSTKLPTKLATK
jgi:hypothetical protein